MKGAGGREGKEEDVTESPAYTAASSSSCVMMRGEVEVEGGGREVVVGALWSLCCWAALFFSSLRCINFICSTLEDSARRPPSPTGEEEEEGPLIARTLSARRREGRTGRGSTRQCHSQLFMTADSSVAQ